MNIENSRIKLYRLLVKNYEELISYKKEEREIDYYSFLKTIRNQIKIIYSRMNNKERRLAKIIFDAENII